MNRFYFPNNVDLFYVKLSNTPENRLSIALSIFPIYKLSKFLGRPLDDSIVSFSGSIRDIYNDPEMISRLLEIGNQYGVFVGSDQEAIHTDPWLIGQRVPLKTLLEENQYQLQKIFFERKKNVVITGGTGVGKTSQVPKILWYFNCLFDGFDCFNSKVDIDKTSTLMDLQLDLKHQVIQYSDLSLMFPRKQLITSSYINMYKSLGEIPVFNLLHRDSKIKYNGLFRINFVVPKLGSFVANNTSIVIFDEIHEHDSAMDTMISIYSKSYLRGSLRNIVLMSATIEDDKKDFDLFFKNNWEHFHIKGERQFPIKEHFVKGSYMDMLDYKLPGKGETGILFFSSVTKVLDALEELKLKYDNKVKLFPIYSKSSYNDKYILEAEATKNMPVILVSTPILESSITISNATIVYDTRDFYLPIMYFSGSTYHITQSMYEQRKGRVGRVRPGTYLYNVNQFSSIRKIDVSPLAPFIFEFSKFNLTYKDMFQRPLRVERWYQTREWFIRQSGMSIRSLYRYYKNLGDFSFDPLLLLKIKEKNNALIRDFFKQRNLTQDQLFELAKILNFTGSLSSKRISQDNVNLKYTLDNPIEMEEKTIDVNIEPDDMPEHYSVIYVLEKRMFFYS